ncbi:MAG: SRPBCC family protein [Roseiflexaceae bacterium]
MPRVGHRFQFRTAPVPGFDGVVSCEVLEVDEPRRLSYTWQGGWLRRPTVVTWTLEPVAEGTRVLLDHNGFEGLGGFALSAILGVAGAARCCARSARSLRAWKERHQ